MNLEENKQIFIFTQPRTGSNNVSYCFNCHPELNVGNELLHPHNGIKFDQETVSRFKRNEGYDSFGFARHWSCFYDDEVIEKVVSDIFNDHNGFKIHTSHIDDNKKAALLHLFPQAKVVLTTRHNRYEQAMSNFVAYYTNVWHAGDDMSKECIKAHKVDKDEFSRWIEQQIDDEKRLKAILRERKIPYFEFSFDSFFSMDLTKKIQYLNSAFEFLGLKKIGQYDNPIRTQVYSEIQRYLDPTIQRVTKSYSTHIANHKELEKLCIENGWV